MEKSLAGTGQMYVSLQGRLREHDLHIQGKGPKVNREYGVVIDIAKVAVDEMLWSWLAGLETPLGSLADSAQKYFALQARPKGGNLHFQVSGSEFNRDYGATFDIPLSTRPDLATFYKAVDAAETAEEDCLDDYEEDQDWDNDTVPF